MAKILVENIEDLKSLQEGVVKMGLKPFTTEKELTDFFKKTGYETDGTLEDEWKNAEWLKIKHSCIGGSDAGVVTGVSTFKGPTALAIEKMANFELEKNTPEKQFMFDFGHAFEEVARKHYARKTGAKVLVDRRMFQNEQYPYMIADLDGLAITPEGELIILEYKFTNFRKIKEYKEGVHGQSGNCPVKTYFAQVQHCMNVLGDNLRELFPNEKFFNNRIERADIIVGSSHDAKDCKIVTIMRDDKFIDSLVMQEVNFMGAVDSCILPENRKVVNDEEFDKLVETFKSVDIDTLENLAEDISKEQLETIVRLENEKAEINSKARKQAKEIDDQLNSLYLPIYAKLEAENIKEGKLEKDGYLIEVENKVTESLPKSKLKKEYPEFYAANVETKEKTVVSIEKKPEKDDQ